MIWETRVIVYQDVEAETYEEACAIAEELFKADTHHEEFEVDAYPSAFDSLIQEALESGKHIINDEAVPPLDEIFHSYKSPFISSWAPGEPLPPLEEEEEECFEPGRPVNDIMALNP
jgi:hypothetical protein